MSSGSGTVRVMPAGAGVVHVGTRAGIVVGVVVDTVQIGRRIRLSTCGTQSSQTIVVGIVVVVVGIRRTSCALRCVVAVYRRCWLG